MDVSWGGRVVYERIWHRKGSVPIAGGHKWLGENGSWKGVSSVTGKRGQAGRRGCEPSMAGLFAATEKLCQKMTLRRVFDATLIKCRESGC